MVLKDFLAIAKRLLIMYSTTHNHPALLIQVSGRMRRWYGFWYFFWTVGCNATKDGVTRSWCLQRYNSKCGFEKKSTSSQLVSWRFSVSGSYWMHGSINCSLAANASMHDRGILGKVANLLGDWAWEIKKMQALEHPGASCLVLHSNPRCVGEVCGPW